MIPPDIDFYFTDEVYDRLAELLAPHGIGVRDATREVRVDAGSHRVSSECCSGVLIHQGHEFPYYRSKFFLDPDFPWQVLGWKSPDLPELKQASLTVDLTTQEPEALENLLDALERIFPDPPPSLLPS